MYNLSRIRPVDKQESLDYHAKSDKLSGPESIPKLTVDELFKSIGGEERCQNCPHGRFAIAELIHYPG